MKRPDYRSPIFALGLALFASMTVFAQTEKITLKMVPEPNQTVRMRMIHEMEIDVIVEGETTSAEALPETMKVISRAVFALTQKVGAPDKEGNITSEFSYDEVTSETTMNGQPMQLGDAAGKFIGQKILATFNKRGEMVDLKIPPELGLSQESFKTTLKSLYGDLPQTVIGVGEVATTPLDFTLPLPVPGAPPLKIDGHIKYALTSIEQGATGRVAKFNQTVDGKMVSDMDLPRPNGRVKVSLDFKLNGGGDLVMDIDKGVLKSSDSKTTFGGMLKATDESSVTKLPTINMRGTLKTRVTGDS